MTIIYLENGKPPEVITGAPGGANPKKAEELKETHEKFFTGNITDEEHNSYVEEICGLGVAQ